MKKEKKNYFKTKLKLDNGLIDTVFRVPYRITLINKTDISET